MTRTQVINAIAKKIEAKNYLEIGLQYPSMNYNHINIETKHSVDPGYDIDNYYQDNEDTTNYATHEFESDVFFKKLRAGEHSEFSKDHKWDLIFVDGLHLADQVWRDVMNSVNHLSDSGVIVMHDCNPFCYDNKATRVLEDQHNNQWNGTTWKAMYRLRFSKPDLAVCTLNTDQGLGIVMKGKQDCVEFKNKFFEYRVFEKNLVEDLNLIKDWGVFIKWLEKNNLKLNSKH
jgi:hypothetical protein